jgi:hypothetical protein
MGWANSKQALGTFAELNEGNAQCSKVTYKVDENRASGRD